MSDELSSSYNPTSNGLSECGVAVIKDLLKNVGAKKGSDL